RLHLPISRRAALLQRTGKFSPLERRSPWKTPKGSHYLEFLAVQRSLRRVDKQCRPIFWSELRRIRHSLAQQDSIGLDTVQLSASRNRDQAAQLCLFFRVKPFPRGSVCRCARL